MIQNFTFHAPRNSRSGKAILNHLIESRCLQYLSSFYDFSYIQDHPDRDCENKYKDQVTGLDRQG